MVLSKYAGASVRRKEDPRLITGSSTYVDDVKLPGLLSLALVRSPYAHARINGIDATAALATPGVVAVVTGADLERLLKNQVAPRGEGGETVSNSPGGESETGEHANEPESGEIPTPVVHPLAIDTVRFVGHAVAAVVAESAAVAEDAVDLVEVDYEPLEAVTDPYAAMADGAPLLYEEVPNNISTREGATIGDVDAAFAGAAITAKARIRAQRLAPLPMEPRGVLAAPDPITRGLTVWTSTQAPHWNRNDIAEALGLSQNQVRCIAPEVGGGFGAKIGTYPEDLIVPAVAMRLGRPVKWIETRSENFLVTNHGRNQWADIAIAADETGKILALRGDVVLDSGAYPKALDLAWATWVMSTGCYDIPALDYHVTGVYTNTMANGAYRGAGRPEAAYYVERAIDLLADAGGFDPVEVRRRNFLQPEQFPYRTHSGERYDTGDYEKPLAKATELIGYEELRRRQAELRAQGRYLGIGVASYVEICGFGPYESATLRVEPGGAVTIFTGISPHGQGQETTFSQLAAQHLGADFDQVVVHHGDTGNTPQGNGTMGSRGLAVGGAALMLAIATVREKASRVAAHMLEAAVEDIELVDGTFRVRGVPDRGVTLAEIAKVSYSGDAADLEVGLEATEFFRPDDKTFPFGTHIAVVEVFPETGEVKIERYVSVDDCGFIVSPLLVTGQVHGGLAQGIGQALFEELHYDASGELITGTLNDYAMPRAVAFPEFETHHTETRTPLNPLGSKGIGEAATIGSTPAIANAVIDALEPWDVTHLDTPFIPEKVWRAIQGAPRQEAAAAD
ncbi:MAG: Aerobic carbon monoxide dehydrogenase (quinone), large chain [uncultured Thermomicrobiales bacterium]|uniref:Aerobic carbon monoxide dehydrogenase (Quinone), large chain n=1 Tax=uncultured Thermomicrobiales bacterium TaxID=1645740 RepID=A0A6J4V8W9_9BACT|nr:MAG: Aerobic carbon monoxide dehydrogenase (quinone), large chain [uncultured Thermomicrobiales bacterium]